MNKKRLKGIASATLIALMVGAFSGCGILPKEEETLAPPLVAPQKAAYTTYKVAKGVIEDSYAATGSMVSSDESSLYFTDGSKRIKHITVKVGDTVKKGQVLVETEAGDIDLQVKIEQYTVQMKQVDYNSAAALSDANNTEKARLTLLIEQTKLQQLLNQQQASRLVSPINGQVTFVESVQDGATFDAFKTLVTVANPNSLLVNCVYKADQGVKVGMKAKLKIGTNNLVGSVISIPQATTTTTTNTSLPPKGISIRVDNLPSGTKISDPVSVSIALQSKSDVLVVPINGVQSYNSVYSVQTWDGTIKKEVNIQIGIKTATQVEIVSGVAEGQQIILN